MQITLTLSILGGSPKLSKWLSAALHAALSGASLTLGAIFIDPATFNLAQAKHLAGVAGAGALIGLIGLLRNNPLSDNKV
jgi:hypothetical protein